MEKGLHLCACVRIYGHMVCVGTYMQERLQVTENEIKNDTENRDGGRAFSPKVSYRRFLLDLLKTAF